MDSIMHVPGLMKLFLPSEHKRFCRGSDGRIVGIQQPVELAGIVS